jgi:putative transposase
LTESFFSLQTQYSRYIYISTLSIQFTILAPLLQIPDQGGYMPRPKRIVLSQDEGSIHIISRINKPGTRFDEVEKEYLFQLISVFASGFFVDIHAFCIMGTHFHILATALDRQAEEADRDELWCRYRLMYGEKSDPPSGSHKSDGCFEVDEDGGEERLRRRLGSVSRFVQELKQSFSLWYNRRHGLRGYLWHDRYKGIVLDHGEAELVCSAYIDLNPVRANMVRCPEDYRWSSLGLRVRDPRYADELLSHCEVDLCWYRQFVYSCGGVEREGKAGMAEGLVEEVLKAQGRLGVGERLRYRVRNLSEGVAIGSYRFRSEVQRRYNRKFIRPRSFFDEDILFSTRVLKDGD